MPDLRISQLTPGDPAQSSDEIPVNRSGTNFSVTAGSVAALANSSAFESLPAWFMSGDGSNYSFSTSPGLFSTGTANLIQFWMVQIFRTIKITTASFRYIGAGAGGVGGIAIYDSTGQTKLASFDNFAFSGGAGPKTITATGGSVILNPGVYIVACAQSVSGASASTQGSYLTQGTSDDTNAWNATSLLRSGVGSNSMVAGVLPAALGTLTRSASGPAANIPSVCFEP